MLENLSEKEREILNVIKTVIDPEVAINIVDLGLIYEVNYHESEKKISILMTLSARGCPVGDTIISHVKTVIENEYPNVQVNVDLVWEPQWTPSLITDEGREALNQ
jgi:metal-sulfur cluster biosynthetic enzyme